MRIEAPDRDRSRHLQSSLHQLDAVIEDASASNGREAKTSNLEEE
jgi:hypothetical protein